MITEKLIQSYLIKDLYEKGKTISVCNFSLNSNEADVFAVNPKTGMGYEYEIKLSKSDYKKDFVKVKHEYYSGKKQGIYVPNFFYYICPFNLIAKEEIPFYAGLIYCTVVDTQLIFTTVKRAKKLNACIYQDYHRIAQNLTAKIVFGSSYLTYINNKRKESFFPVSPCDKQEECLYCDSDKTNCKFKLMFKGLENNIEMFKDILSIH